MNTLARCQASFELKLSSGGLNHLCMSRHGGGAGTLDGLIMALIESGKWSVTRKELVIFTSPLIRSINAFQLVYEHCI